MTATNSKCEESFHTNVAKLASNLTIGYSGWTPPTTTGGTWCRVSPDGVYEFWPRDLTKFELITTPEVTSHLIDVRPLRKTNDEK